MSHNGVLIVDWKNVISHQNVLKRHINYGNALRVLNPSLRLLIISRGQNLGTSSGSISHFSENRILHFLLLLRRVILHNNIKLLVSGDPWDSAIVTFISKCLLNPSIKIEVQIHADIANPKWIFARPRNVLKFLVCFITLRLANQIRFVSQEQRQNALRRFKLGSKNTYVAPVVLTGGIKYERKLKKRNCLGIVGRLEKDRGTDGFLKLCRFYGQVLPTMNFLIVGDGSERLKLEELARRSDRGCRAEFLGDMNIENIESAWSQIGLLISLAPTESFGRSIREALVRGIPVACLRTSGAKDLQVYVPSPYLNLYEDIDDLMEHCPVEELVSVCVPTAVSEVIEKNMSNAVRQLCQEWQQAIFPLVEN